MHTGASSRRQRRGVAEAAPVGFSLRNRIGVPANDLLSLFKRSQAEG
jgi:hypothetical protein